MRLLGAPSSDGVSRRRKRVFYNPYTKKIEVKKLKQKKKYKLVEAQGYFHPEEKGIDAEWIGDNMEREADKQATRFLFNNCHGLDFNKKDNNYMKSKIQAYLSTGAHYIAFAETGVNIYKGGNQQLVNEIAEEVIGEGMTTVHHGKSLSESDFQWGGVGTIMYGRLHHRWLTTEKDRHGRWIMQKFFGEKRNLCVYTLYRVNPGDTAKGGSTSAWSQQQYTLGLEKIYEDPRKQVMKDIYRDINKKIKEGNSIILMADLNEGVASREKSNETLETMGLVNVMESKIKSEIPNTYRYGSCAIDHIWATGDICAHIKKAGISPFNYPAYSDHRSLVIDIDMKQILDADYLFLKSFIGRTLKMSMPERVEKYGEEVVNQWNYHKIEEKYSKVQILFKKRGPTKSNVCKLNKLDKQITEIMLCAERKCSRIGRKPTVPWSPKIHEAVQKIYRAGYNRRIARKLLRSDNVASRTKYDDAKKAYKEAKLEYKQVKIVSEKLREEFLDKRIKLLQEQKSEFRDKRKIKILKILKHREKQRDQARRINYVLQKQRKAGLTSILIPSQEAYVGVEVDIYDIPTMWKRLKKANGKDVKKWIRITDRATMEKLLGEWQRYHFMQANETPFSSQEWEKILADENNQERILNGEFILHEKYPAECQLLFDCMKKETTVKPDVNCHTSYGDFLSFIKKADETTSASPSGRTYSHYKALASEASFILEYIHGLFSLALQHQVVLNRWSITITTLIMKDDVPKIHRLRTLHIVEAELQFISKKTYAQRMMRKAESKNLLTDEQYGGRKQRQALSVVINKMLYYDITRQKLSRAAFMDDDARACYDRIVPHIAEVETQKWGVQRETAQITTKILKSQQFHIRTSHGIGQQTYTNHDHEKTHGAGQGLGWSGPLWTCSSDTISKALNKSCTGMTYKSVDGGTVVNKCGDFFVDDTATGVTENNIRMNKTLLEELGILEQTHAYLMFAEGHKIAFDKCSFYLVDFEREKCGHRFQTALEMPGDLYLREGFHQEPRKIKRLEPKEAHRTLGHYLAIDGNCTRQKEEIRKKIIHWNRCIAASGLTRESKLLAYNGWLLPSIKYKIISCSLDYKECDTIMQIIQPLLLHSHGIAKTCSRVVLHASRKLTGLNVYHLFQVQGFEKLKLFMWHYRRMDTTGQLLKISMDYTQLELGVTQQFFQLRYSKYKHYVTKTWITSIWDYLEQCKAKIDMIHHRQYDSPREGDRYLMEVLIANKIPAEKLIKINQVRLFLKILTLSDMVEVGSRVKILKRVKEGRKSRQSMWEWPRIRQIPKKWMEMWDNVLQTIVTPYLMVHPLGRWKGKTHQLWDGKVDFTGKLLCRNNVHYRLKLNTGTYVRDDSIASTFEYPVDLKVNKDNSEVAEVLSRGRKLSFQDEETNDLNDNYRDIVNNLPYWEKRNLGDNIPSEHDFKHIEQLLLDDQFLAISDGSYKDGKASHAWCVAHQSEKKKIILSAGPVDGNKNEVSAFRAEAMGIIAILSIIGIVEAKGVVGKAATIQLDCKSLINKIVGTKVESIRYVEDEDIDVVIEIRHRLETLKTPLRVLHVKGHQDKHMSYDELPFTAKLNCDMDQAAKNFLRNSPSHLIPKEKYPILPAQAMVVTIRNKLIVRDIREDLNDSWIRTRWEAYMGSVLKIKKDDLNKVNLRALTKYIKENRVSAGSVAKIIHEQINTFVVCKRWKTSSSEICPLCKVAPETYRHVLSCTFPPLQQSRNTSLNYICDQLKLAGTQPALYLFIQQAIQSFAVDYPLAPPKLTLNETDVQLNIIHRSQNRIGWNNFFRGYITVHMEKMQEEYLKAQGDPTPFLSAQQWGNKLVCLVVNHYRTSWKNRCDALALINDETLQKRRRDMACGKLAELQNKWWVLLQKDRHLLNQDAYWLSRAPYSNVQMWIQQIEAALSRAEHLKEVKGNDIRRYLQRQDPGCRDILAIVPSQIEHRKSKYGGIGNQERKYKLRFGSTGVTRVAVTKVGKYKQLKLIRDGRTNTARDAHDTGSHVK